MSRRTFLAAGRGGGVNSDASYVVKTQAIGKGKSEGSPYLIANEWIAANIAQFLRLPVPPFAIVRKKSPKTAMHISYSFDGDTKPDDVDPVQLFNNHPDVCTGITLFDILVANCDRHSGNLKVDRPANPTCCYIIDHERALFYINQGDGVARLRSREKRLGIADGVESADEWHCLIGLLNSIHPMRRWINRIHRISNWFIDDICEEMHKLSLKRAEVDEAKSFLKARRDNIATLIETNKERFPSVTDWELTL